MNERVKELRNYLGLSAEKFGSRLGVTRSAISRIENGIVNLTDQMQKSICREFNVNEEWLRNGTGEMFIEQTRDEQIATFIGSLQSDESDSFKKRFISMLSALDESEWEVLEKMAIMLTKEKEDQA